MAISLTDSVKQLMLQIKFEMDVDSLNTNIICTLCNKIMIDAYQTYCGCNYCRGCITAFLEEENKYCLGGKDVCKEEHLILESNVAISPMVNRTILRAKIHCPNKPCPCVTELTNIEEHLRLCTLQSMECPFSLIGCENDEASKESILVHLRDDTLTHSQLLIELINSLKNEVRVLKEDFSKSKLEQSREKEVQIGEMRKEMAEKYELEMENQKRETNGLKGEIARLKEKCDEREIMMDGMKKEMATLKKEMDGVKREEATLKKEMVELKECSRNIKNTVETSKRESTKYRDETRSTLTKMKKETAKKESAATVTQSMNNVRARVDKLADIIDKVNVGTNTKVAVGQSSFTVDKFSARDTTEEVILCPYFYSHTNGYKLRLQLYPGGFGVGRGTHLSVSIKICRGEYDDVLLWPCRHTFTLSVINQRDGGTYASETFNYATAADNLKDTFDKPINKDNDANGCQLVSHANLQSVDGLTVDDSVIVRCVVSAPPLLSS